MEIKFDETKYVANWQNSFMDKLSFVNNYIFPEMVLWHTDFHYIPLNVIQDEAGNVSVEYASGAGVVTLPPVEMAWLRFVVEDSKLHAP